MTITELCQKAHQMAVEKGWWQFKRSIPELLCLIHSEISEALEEYRNGSIDTIYYVDGKPEGMAVEIADAVIRIGDMCAEYGIDLEKAIEIKMAYNSERPYRHGGKKC